MKYFKLNINLKQYLETCLRTTNSHKIHQENESEKDQAIKTTLTLKISDYSNKMSYFAKNNSERYETQIVVKDKLEPKERLQMKVNENRMKRLVSHAKFKIQSMNEILNFKYPRISWAFYIIATLFALIFNMNYLVMYIMILSTFTILSYNEDYQKSIKEYFKDYESYYTQQNKDYFENEIMKIEDSKLQKKLDSKRITIIKLESILKKLGKLYKFLGMVNFMLFQVTSFLEKVKNLYTWLHYQKTYMVLKFSFLAIFLYIVTPFNIIFAALILGRCMQGRSFYKQTKTHNVQLMKAFISEIIKKNYPEYNENIEHPERSWCKKCDNFEKLNQKVQINTNIQIVEEIKETFKLDVNDELLYQFESMNCLCTHLSSIHEQMYLPKDIGETQYKDMAEKDKFIKKRSMGDKVFSYIFYFIYNIPSDYYRVLYPPKNSKK